MMNYDFLKILWNSGFPKIRTDGCGMLVSPSLRELIDACGERFSQITQLPPIIDDPKKWIAHAWMGMEKSPSQITAMGETPEEAVALLWLELNKDTNVKASGYGTEGSGKG